MYEDLEQLAALRFGKELEDISAQTRENIREAKNRFAATSGGVIRSGHHDAQLGQIRVDGTVQLAQALCQIWVNLIEQRNGRIARPDVGFVVGKIESLVNSQKQHLYRAFQEQGGGVTVTLTQKADMELYAVCARARRDLEIKARETELFPMKPEKNPMQQKPKQRFSPGRRVLKGVGMQPATVQSVGDVPSTLGEFVHVVIVDGQSTPESALGCDLYPFPELDADLKGHAPNIHIQNSTVANLNLGSQVGIINASLQQIAEHGSDPEFVSALREFTDAVVSASLEGTAKQEIVEALSTIAEQATKKPEERSKATLKALVSWIPTAASAATQLSTLWDKYGSIIKAHFGI